MSASRNSCSVATEAIFQKIIPLHFFSLCNQSFHHLWIHHLQISRKTAHQVSKRLLMVAEYIRQIPTRQTPMQFLVGYEEYFPLVWVSRPLLWHYRGARSIHYAHHKLLVSYFWHQYKTIMLSNDWILWPPGEKNLSLRHISLRSNVRCWSVKSQQNQHSINTYLLYFIICLLSLLFYYISKKKINPKYVSRNSNAQY